jgi:hypothetical protein
MARREYNGESKVIRREDFISSRLFLYSTTSTFSSVCTLSTLPHTGH